MEYAWKMNLKQFISNFKIIDQIIEEDIIKDIVTQICFRLREIHKNKIINIDLTPENIFINGKKKIKKFEFSTNQRN